MYKYETMESSMGYQCNNKNVNNNLIIFQAFTTIPVEGLRSSSMTKRYLRARNTALVDGTSM